jgi:hypothetical protein
VLLFALLGGAVTSLNEKPAAASTNDRNNSVPLYQVTGTVLQAPGKKTELCASVLTSLPPQCGGPIITNWRWADVGGSQTANGVTWGSYRVVGAYAKNHFTLTETPVTSPSPKLSPSSVDTTPGCSQPKAGPTSTQVSFAQWQLFTAKAQAPTDFAGMWVHQTGPTFDPGRDIYTVAYTGNLSMHETELRAIWPGPLCIVKRPRSYVQLQAIQTSLEKKPGNLQVIIASVDMIHDLVALQAFLVTPSDQRELDRRFGRGTVKATSWLERVS